jgi:hypothetical protein
MSEKISHLPVTSPPLSFARVRLRETDMGGRISHMRSASRNPLRIQKLALPCCDKPIEVQGNQETISSRNWPDWMGYRVSVDSLMPQPRNERRKGHRGVHCIPAVSSGRKDRQSPVLQKNFADQQGPALGRRSASGRFSHPVTRVKVMASADSTIPVSYLASLTQTVHRHVGI